MLGALSLLPADLLAQQRLDESVAVDGRYKAEVVRMNRINTFPKRVRATLSSNPLPYDETGVAADFAPTLIPMGPTGWMSERQRSDSRGYLDLALCSWLNSSLSAGYRVLPAGGQTSLDVRLQHNSTSLQRPELLPHLRGARRYCYDETIGVDAGHTFKGAGRLSASAQYRLNCFNYYATLPYTTGNPEDFKAPTQTLNDASLRLGWTPERQEGRADWRLQAAYRYFGYRALYLPAIPGGYLASGRGGRENHIQVAGYVGMPATDRNSWNLSAQFDALIYGDQEWVNNPKSYSHISLTPGYEGKSGSVSWRVGLRLDFTAGAGSQGDKAGWIHLAPDARVSWAKGPVTLYASATGGDRLQTLASRSAYDPYGLPALWSSTPAYAPLNGAVGVSLRPMGGLTLTFEGAYRIERHVEMGGLYQLLLNRPYGLKPSVPGIDTSLELHGRNVEGLNLHGARLRMAASYESKVFSLGGEIAWQNQKGATGWFNGYDRPRYTASLNVGVRPVEPLRIEAGLEWRGHRAVYSWASPDPASMGPSLPDGGNVVINGGTSDVKYPLAALRLRDITDLHLSAAWALTPAIEVRVEGSNLLNRRVDALPGLPAQGITFAAGASVKF